MATKTPWLTAFVLLLAAPTALARPAVTVIEVDNERNDTITVEVDDRVLGQVVADSERTFTVPPGRHLVEIRTLRGERVMAETVHLRRGEREDVEVEANTRPLLMVNPTALALKVEVEGRTLTLSPYERRSVEVEGRQVEVTVSAKAFGIWQDLGEERVRMARGRHGSSVTLGTSMNVGFVRVANLGEDSAEILVDGRRYGSIGGQDARVLSLPTGHHTVALQVRGELTDQEVVRLSRLEEERVGLEGLRYGQVVVFNPNRWEVTIVGDRGRERTVAGGGSITYDRLPPGSYEVSAYTAGGGFVDTETLVVHTGDTLRWTVATPRRGHHRHGDRVHERGDRGDGYVDGGEGYEDAARAEQRDRSDRDDSRRDRSRR